MALTRRECLSVGPRSAMFSISLPAGYGPMSALPILPMVLALVILASGCEAWEERKIRKEQERLVEELRRDNAARAQTLDRQYTEHLKKPRSDSLAVNPCDRPRPYKNWSNAQLNAAQVEYMGTDKSQGLINEAACRQ